MAQRSQIFESIDGDRIYPADQYSRQLQNLSDNGYINNLDNELVVTENTTPDLSVLVSTGGSWVEGRYYQLYSSPKNLSISSNSTGDPRIDRIVVRLDNSNNQVTSEVLEGTAAADPSPPSLTRNDTVWELSLAQVYVASGTSEITNSDITDERDDQTLCGLSTHPNLGGSYLGDYFKGSFSDSITSGQNKITGITVKYDTSSWLNSSGDSDTLTVDQNGIYLVQIRYDQDADQVEDSLRDDVEGRFYMYLNGSTDEIWYRKLFSNPSYENIYYYRMTFGVASVKYLQSGDSLSFYTYYGQNPYNHAGNIEVYQLTEQTL
ncbi:hypothetical protein [Methanohalobium sp.]|uniref:hypothetical protein n=1 Tax=Methanohalobium sp. TaxID=2837493 RepID=UPI0025D1890C|nr:hypothetical protein [Methanohalobium sp.]